MAEPEPNSLQSNLDDIRSHKRRRDTSDTDHNANRSQWNHPPKRRYWKNPTAPWEVKSSTAQSALTDLSFQPPAMPSYIRVRPEGPSVSMRYALGRRAPYVHMVRPVSPKCRPIQLTSSIDDTRRCLSPCMSFHVIRGFADQLQAVGSDSTFPSYGDVTMQGTTSGAERESMGECSQSEIH